MKKRYLTYEDVRLLSCGTLSISVVITFYAKFGKLNSDRDEYLFLGLSKDEMIHVSSFIELAKAGHARKKESTMVVGCKVKIQSLGLTVPHHSASFMMLDNVPCDGIFGPKFRAI